MGIEVTRREMLKGTIITTGVMGLLYLREKFGLPTAEAADVEAVPAKLRAIPTAELPTNLTQDLGIAQFEELVNRNPLPYSRSRVVLNSQDFLKLRTIPGYAPNTQLERVQAYAESAENNVLYEVTVFCDEAHKFYISWPELFTTADIALQDGSVLKKGSLVSFTSEGVAFSTEPSTYVDSMVDTLVVSPDLKAAYPDTYSNGAEKVNFNDYSDGTVINVVRTPDPQNSKLVQVGTESGAFSFAELSVDTQNNIRSERSASATIIRSARENGAKDFFVSSLQMSLDQARAIFQEAALEEENDGRFFVQEPDYKWYLIGLRDKDKNPHSIPYGWMRSDAAGSPELAYASATSLPPASVESTSTPNPNEPDPSQEAPEPERPQEAPTEEKKAETAPAAIERVQNVENVFVLKGMITEIVTSHVPFGNLVDFEVFAVIEYVNKYSEKSKVAVPLAYNFPNNGNSVVYGMDPFPNHFDGRSLTNVAKNIFPIGSNVRISCSDVYSENSVWGIEQHREIMEQAYSKDALQNFANSENPEDLPVVPGFPNINGAKVLVPLNIQIG